MNLSLLGEQPYRYSVRLHASVTREESTLLVDLAHIPYSACRDSKVETIPTSFNICFILAVLYVTVKTF